MSYSKKYLDALLEADKRYTAEKILHFKNLPNNIPTKSYTDFVYGSVSNPNNPFKIEPFELFLLNIDEPNAFAFEHNGMYMIGIHMSLFSLLEKKIKEKVPDLKDKAEALISSIEKCLPEGLDGQFTMFQFITLFTYYHELGHLHQIKKRIKDLGKLACFEKYFLTEGKEFDQIAHAMEIDADLFAANQITNHIIQYWNSFEEAKRTIENLEALISMVSASIFLFFFELSGGRQNLYFLDFDHPHSLIRTSYITDAIVNIAELNQKEGQPKPNLSRCVLDGLMIAQQLLNNGANDGLNEFIQNYINYKEPIGDYIDEMSVFNKTVPFLISNSYT